MSFFRMINCTAASLRAMLAYVNGDDPVLQAKPELVEGIRRGPGDQHGSVSVGITFDQKDESDAFSDVAKQIGAAAVRLRDSGAGIAVDFRMVLLYIDPEGGPRLAYDDDSLADKLVGIVSAAVGEAKGKDPVSIDFGDDEALARQFRGVTGNISKIMDLLASQ